MPDPIFDDPRLAAIYDPLDPIRNDLDAYVALVGEFNAQSVLDVGCGTGTFACLLAGQGVDVVTVDPAEASLDVARRKHHAEKVSWIHGDATALPPLAVDVVTMTGNVAQVFLTNQDWFATLRGVRAALKPGGNFIFETRDPAAMAWLAWNHDQTRSRTEIPGVGAVKTWCDLLRAEGGLVTFRSSHVFESDGAVLTSDSTLRFRGRHEIEESLRTSGFVVEDVREAPDRPGLEFVFLAARPA